jgi:hypothetical protein
MTFETFSYYASSLIGMSTDVYVKMLLPVDNLLKVCFESAGVKETSEDAQFLESFKEEMVSMLKSFVKLFFRPRMEMMWIVL